MFSNRSINYLFSSYDCIIAQHHNKIVSAVGKKASSLCLFSSFSFIGVLKNSLKLLLCFFPLTEALSLLFSSYKIIGCGAYDV